MRSDRLVADPRRAGRSSQDRHTRLPSSCCLDRTEEPVAIRVPTVAEEAVRDLCRAKTDMAIDQTRTRHRLGMFLLRHNRIWWRGWDDWTLGSGRSPSRGAPPAVPPGARAVCQGRAGEGTAFGQMKVRQHAGESRLRCRAGDQGAWPLHVICHNLRKLANAGGMAVLAPA